MQKKKEPDSSVRSVRRAFAVLRAFRVADRALALGDIAERAKLDKATTRRLLMTLMSERLVEQNTETKAYSLSLGVLELGAGLTPTADLQQRAQSILISLAEQSAATAFLGVPHDGEALCIGRADGGVAIQVRNWAVGGRIPYHCGAGPRVLMAFRPASELARLLSRPLKALTPSGPSDPEELEPILARIRKRDWELATDDVVEGISGVGVPVRDRSGAVIATLSISGLNGHILDGRRPRHLGLVQSKARELEQRIE